MIFSKIGGVWKKAKSVFIRQAGQWKKVRKIFIKTAAGWKQAFSDNVIGIWSMGLQTNIDPTNVGVWINGIHVYPAQRNYNVIQFDRWGNVVSNNTFDVFGEIVEETTGQIQGMTDVLNAMPAGRIFAVYTYDEPDKGHKTEPLLTAMYSVGATPAIYGQDMAYRSAYLLIGRKGSPALFEQNVGVLYGPGPTGTGDPNAHIYQEFKITEDKITLL